MIKREDREKRRKNLVIKAIKVGENRNVREWVMKICNDKNGSGRNISGGGGVE